MDVEQKRLRGGRIGVAHQPALDGRAVRDRELALLAREELDFRRIGAVSGADLYPIAGQVDDGDLAVRRRCRQYDSYQ